MKKTISLIFLLLIISGMLSGCVESIEYVVYTDDSFEPFCSVDTSGEPKGFDVDLIKLIALEEDIKVKIVAVGLVESLEALENDKADGVIAAIIPTDEFDELFDFSDCYYNEYSFAVAKNKNHDLLDKFNEGLKKIKDNGKYDELITKYFSGASNE